MHERIRFDGRVVVVTGGGGGLGRCQAQLLAERGAAVVVNDVVGPDGVVDSIVAAGGRAMASPHDITDPTGAEALVAAAVDRFGRLDAVVNTAGILRSAELASTSDAMWDAVLGVNLRGSFLVTRAAWPTMVAQGFGRVVFTTSNSGLLGIAGSSAYAASKAALWGLTRVLTLEGEAHGINVNAVAPIAFTPMSQQSRAAPPSWRSGEGDAWAAKLDPALVAPVVAWLIHEHCSLRGEVLSAAGGRVARFFLGLTPGIVDDALTLEAMRAFEADIVAEPGYEVLRTAADESRRLHRRLLGSEGSSAV